MERAARWLIPARPVFAARVSSWAAFAFASSAAYVVLRVLAFEHGAYRLGDTQSYEHAAHLPLLSLRFLAGERPLVVPLAWKILGSHRAVIAGQLALSVIAWLLLANVAATSVRHWGARLTALWLLFGLSLSTPVTEWDHDLMSESIALSLCALLFALVLLVLRRPGRGRLAAALGVGLAWAMTRDTNAFAAVVVIPALIAAVFLRRRALPAAALVGTVAVFAASLADAAHGHRVDQPVRDTLYIRLPKDNPAALRWMRGHGYTGLYGGNTTAVYKSFLLHHPWWVLTAPFRDRPTYATFSSKQRLTALYTPAVTGYDAGGYRLRIPSALQRLFWPARPIWLGIELLVILAAAAVAFVRRGFDRLLVVPAVALLAAYPQILAVWHFSGQEVDRHALVAALVVRIALILIATLAVDALLAARRPSRA